MLIVFLHICCGGAQRQKVIKFVIAQMVLEKKNAKQQTALGTVIFQLDCEFHLTLLNVGTHSEGELVCVGRREEENKDECTDFVRSGEQMRR